ncbi:uncharacterized protein MYCGRDRAFT_90148 [Zymoseptoria tritici IPO323]|uniref:Uncharacterized protein n=1 Tax=Zymoseptoria tritici (strain CBS 115943 / IPO323) TaxID=336722 RepID=F9X0Q1_ZYMTI|nr:uncharacterized protein MYCGRDRAFT_90148 [Zymoseptoria tritici IPO323]EGP91918.1 hypothetical protein MYCGRDRAFT_90148 [Zymoseptoria tritici IPO323]
MPADARLLVHAGASTSWKGDDQSRSQLAAYLKIGATHVARRLPMILPESGSDGDDNHDRHEAMSDIDSAGHPDSTTWIDDTQLAYTALESQLYTGFSEPEVSAFVGRRSASAAAYPRSQMSDHVRSGQDVQPRSQNSEQLSAGDDERLSKRPRLEQYHASVGSWTGSSKNASPAHDGHTGQMFGDAGESAGDTAISNETTSELPTTYTLSDLASHGLNARPLLTQRSASDPGPTPINREGALDSLRSIEVSPSKPVPDIFAPKEALETVAPAQLFAKVVPPKDPKLFLNASRLQTVEEMQMLSNAIRPSQPTTSLARYTTHMSPALQHLANDPGLSSAFRPVSSSRAIDPLERGHWLVECAEWPPELQVKFWKTLETIIGEGNAGWGVWCSRGREAPITMASQLPTSVQPDDAAQFGPVRVFCWGEVVKHVYLLLYVASSSKVRKLGLQWVDAEDLVVVQMQGTAGSAAPVHRSAG